VCHGPGLIQMSRIFAREIFGLGTLLRQLLQGLFAALHFGAARCLTLKLAKGQLFEEIACESASCDRTIRLSLGLVFAIAPSQPAEPELLGGLFLLVGE
jgi:hypothetical protein